MNRHHIRPILATLAIALAAGLTALLGGAASAQSANDYDTDNDNLIEIRTLEQLDAVRYDLDGNGTADNNADSYTAAFPDAVTGMGCAPIDGTPTCTGYELARSLDFNDDASYAEATRAANKADWTPNATANPTNNGWTPIGNGSSTSNWFSGTFDGNGHTISNLYVNLPDQDVDTHVGLFGYIAGSGVEVKNVGVNGGSVKVKVTTTGSNFDYAYAGGLAGYSAGKITDSWAAVKVEAETSGPQGATALAYAGGLVGQADSGSVILRSYALGNVEGDAGGQDHSRAGGLVGENRGIIGASFATGAVLADSSSGPGNNNVGWNAYAGGLVGDNNNGTVSASYAIGRVEALRHSSGEANAGGLVGRSLGGTIEASYSRGTVVTPQFTGANLNRGGLIGHDDDGNPTVEDSYWDTVTSDIDDDDDAEDPEGKTTSELQTPTDYTGIYANWNVDYDGNNSADDPWFFGTASDYPRLRGTAPTLGTVVVFPAETLGPGGTITVYVNFDKRVKVTGTPSLSIAIGGVARPAEYDGISTSPTGFHSGIRFTYDVKRGDNGAVTVPDGAITGGTVTDVPGHNEAVSLAFTGASVPESLNAVTVPLDTTKPSVRYKPPTSLTVGQRIRTIVPITDDTDIASYALEEGSFLPRSLRLDPKTGYITGRPTRAVGRSTVVTIIVCDGELDALGNNPNPNCAEVTLKLPAIIDEEADAPPPEPQLPEVPPLDLSTITVGDASPTPTLLLALASAGAALLLAGIGVAAVRQRAPSRRHSRASSRHSREGGNPSAPPARRRT